MRRAEKRGGRRAAALLCLLVFILTGTACGNGAEEPRREEPKQEIPSESTSQEETFPEEPVRGKEQDEAPSGESGAEDFSVEQIVNSFGMEVVEVPEYTGNAYTAVHDNVPFFETSGLPTESFEYYSELDELGRCGIVCANIGRDIMPTEKRGDIGQVKPSGWHTVKYDNVDGNYLYNRCHLIGYQLSAENANEKNLITGTRYLNVMGMLPFENMVADYVKETGNHVLYRVTPLFDGDDLLAYGVLMEGWSVEDAGEGICFNVFAYNVQPDIVIDYATGDSYYEESTQAEETEEAEYILNTNTKKFHEPNCSSVEEMAEKNKQAYSGSREELIGMGYEPCKKCKP